MGFSGRIFCLGERFGAACSRGWLPAGVTSLSGREFWLDAAGAAHLVHAEFRNGNVNRLSCFAQWLWFVWSPPSSAWLISVSGRCVSCASSVSCRAAVCFSCCEGKSCVYFIIPCAAPPNSTLLQISQFVYSKRLWGPGETHLG